MRTIELKRIAVILGVTIAVGGLSAKIAYDRIVHGNDARNACIRNLAYIDGAKTAAAEEHGLKAGAIVEKQELNKYMLGEFPTCPGGGTYTINPIGTEPTCSISGHKLAK
jgi:hypothetical protein